MMEKNEEKQKQDNIKFWMQVVVLPLLGLLLASEGWQYYKAPEKIQQDSKVHSKSHFNENVDSLRRLIANEKFVEGVFSAGAMKYKQIEEAEAEKYLFDVFKLADKGLANDSVWTNHQLPFLIWMMEHKEQLEFLFQYKLLTPIQDSETKQLHFNWIDGLYPITEKRSSNGSVVRRWRDRSDDQHSIQMISSIKDI